MAGSNSNLFQFNNINRVSFNAQGKIHLIQGDEESVLIEGSEEDLEHIKVSQENGTVYIRLFTWYDFLFIPRSAVYTIRIKNLEAFSISGSAEMDCESLDFGMSSFDLRTSGSGRIHINELKCERLKVSSSGSGSIHIQSLETKDIKAGISGSGRFIFAGTTESVIIHISGDGKIEAAELESKTSEIHISGSGRITTQVTDQIDIHISGSGEVVYSGDPQVTSSISGSGKLRRL